MHIFITDEQIFIISMGENYLLIIIIFKMFATYTITFAVRKVHSLFLEYTYCMLYCFFSLQRPQAYLIKYIFQ